jgi:predicted lipoprotein with Yx(FWY)xxD motif
MPPSVELEALAIASGFGFVDAATHATIYAAPPAHRLAIAWQPLRASALALRVGDFAIMHRKDGTRQWTYKGEALYTYAGDYAPGELTGIFAGDKTVHAALAYRNCMPAGVQVRHLELRGPLLTTAKGETLYFVARFFALYGGRETRSGYAVSYNDAKSQGTEACQDRCTSTWKPLLAPPSAQSGGFWEVITRSDGSRQWSFKGSPLYTYVGDTSPGDIKGNNRHVIVYGGSQGQIVYVDAGGNGDPRDPQPQVGSLDMHFAVGAAAEEESSGFNFAGVGGATKESAAAKARGGSAAPVDAAKRLTNGAGAGFYWHTVSLFY